MGRLTELHQYDYQLPGELIAQIPAKPRDHCRLMVLSRGTGQIEHKRFVDVVKLIEPGDLLVINNTKVIKARLLGRKKATNGKVEVLLLRRLAEAEKMLRSSCGKEENFKEVWETIVRPARRIREDTEVLFWKNSWASERSPGIPYLLGKVLSRGAGKFIFGFDFTGTFQENLEKIGEVPLPPYVKRNSQDRSKLQDKKWYQTVFAEKEGAVAAPTAGLHFTRRLLNRIETKGAKVVPLTLHVSWGTFKPVRETEITGHRLDAEYFELSSATARAINQAIEKGKRIIAVGTTTVRVLESCCAERKSPSISARWGKKVVVKPGKSWTELFIYPGFEFKVVDGLITNFHLPQSTLLMLVAAFAGKENIFQAYEEAIKEKYHFYSYGDAMFII
ncbi:tRNA preQ1(34) S-adenosylmethionine ribosyltransferase-isomerase QueA [bacterium]|nr:tRNA preQ1(34) S-adenosylmethionine ribosyltransferase-isomerase QueA [bacterium]NIN92441.1 tRNA preQ1(34) S-adenosylmethionine ribosyltransferase-isomerase QueA [bacterium]NIO18555.1 tRNA preQ1(34) S-adenosylmethionine ribosyltransferase-isomerase QueA [bacterium]NIO73551.1 tRNA preQ1(34) S-adenosylmethionine ribosyltransferase-isomerase QueA [bacterium]